MPVALSTAVCLLLSTWYLIAPPMGTDLSAQVTRGDFFAVHGWAALDFGWYGGVSPYGYSLVSPPLMAWLGGGTTGARLLGVIAALLSTVVFVALLLRTGAARPTLAGLLGAICVFGNLVSGRTTYALGVAFGLLAILAVSYRRSPPHAGTSSPRARTLPARAASSATVLCAALPPVVCAALSAATSPVAGLFVGLAGAAWALSGLATPGLATPGLADRGARATRLVDGALLMVGAAVPMAAMAVLFGAGGWMNISRWDTARAAVVGLVVALLVPRPAVRIGALLSTGGVLAAYAIHTPVGLNATRLAVMFTLPVLAGYARLPGLTRLPGASPGARRWINATALAVVLVAVGWWQPPVSPGDLRGAGDPTAREEYFGPLRAELLRRSPIGRVEVVPLANYWDAAYAPPTVPLARGWLRQADLAVNPLFFGRTLTAEEYQRWLRDNGVTYVALADAEPSWVGRAEAALIRGGVPYLTRVWRDGHWTLYEVAGTPSIAEGARLVASTQTGITIDAPAGEVLIRVRWSRWLSVREMSQGDATPASSDEACLTRSGSWVTLRVTQPGRYEVTGSLSERGPFCPRRP